MGDYLSLFRRYNETRWMGYNLEARGEVVLLYLVVVDGCHGAEDKVGFVRFHFLFGEKNGGIDG